MTDFEELVRASGAPGAVFAVRHNGEVREQAWGLANLDTGQRMTTDTIFEIASVSKLYTATLAMLLADAGKLDLDRPIRHYLPDFAVADERATATVTARHLLTHTSGIDGDKLDDHGRGGDAIERYVAACAALGQVHPVGATQSYCNTGFVILGRLIEMLAGLPWSDALRELLTAPLGLARTFTLPEELIWQRIAAPHTPAGILRVWDNSRSTAPCGGISATAADVLAFAGLHLADGAGLLTAASARAMRSPQVALPNPYGEATHWGLGWKLTVQPDQPLIISHGGANYGHQARLICVPEHDFAAVVLINAGGVDIDSVARPLFDKELSALGVRLPPGLEAPERPPAVDLTRHAGSYRTLAFELSLEPDGGALEGMLRLVTPDAAQLPSEHTTRPITFLPVRDGLYVSRFAGEQRLTPAVFFAIDGQDYLHIGGRAFLRAG
ncbi:CubicO group peptidase (beta-lactamase class C family) [Streptosporangium album]|uniref:CubicO group peptidase (Beta-lactamase class C family) n=1 Tax=Streptosporangium album TaxID=47479 RepID=A0A7W7W958_9ACTN|nr:serine hydrolase domain-containing protein [Streptosporangium album]MBB4937725.1 CubicO group peptidase (beta-lactamase class C family) [Streptosporangium album]